MTKFSILDLVPIAEDSNIGAAIANSADMAALAETLGHKLIKGIPKSADI